MKQGGAGEGGRKAGEGEEDRTERDDGGSRRETGAGAIGEEIKPK